MRLRDPFRRRQHRLGQRLVGRRLGLVLADLVADRGGDLGGNPRGRKRPQPGRDRAELPRAPPGGDLGQLLPGLEFLHRRAHGAHRVAQGGEVPADALQLGQRLRIPFRLDQEPADLQPLVLVFRIGLAQKAQDDVLGHLAGGDMTLPEPIDAPHPRRAGPEFINRLSHPQRARFGYAAFERPPALVVPRTRLDVDREGGHRAAVDQQRLIDVKRLEPLGRGLLPGLDFRVAENGQLQAVIDRADRVVLEHHAVINEAIFERDHVRPGGDWAENEPGDQDSRRDAPAIATHAQRPSVPLPLPDGHGSIVRFPTRRSSAGVGRILLD